MAAVPPASTSMCKAWFDGKVGTSWFFPTANSRTLRDGVHITSLMEHLSAWEGFAYAYPEGSRLAGGMAHNRTLDYIWAHLQATCQYYHLERQPFHQTLVVSGSTALYVNGVGLYGYTMTRAKPGRYTGQLVLVAGSGCKESEYRPQVRGNIALVLPNIDGGACPFSKILKTATAMGAQALVVGPKLSGVPRCSSSPTPYVDGIPATMVLSPAAVQMYLDMMVNPEPFNATLVVNDEPCKEVWSYNIIATSKHGDRNDTIMLGAHSDSVAAGPGINDNGSGSAAILELAILLAKHRIKNRVRFAWWTAEESGLLGSRHWVNSVSGEELDRVRLYLNFDMIASPNFKLGAYDGDGTTFGRKGPPGSEHAQKLFNDFFEAAGWNTSASEMDGRSDYRPFVEAGIPSGGTFTGADATKSPAEARMFGGQAGVPFDHNYHLEKDDTSNINKTALLINTKAIAHALATYAMNVEGLPRRQATRRGHRAVDMPLVFGGLCGGHSVFDPDGVTTDLVEDL